jgi:flagellin
MAQDITLTASMRSNLVSLQNTDVLTNRTQDRLATGKRVNSALDNATNFFAAAAHNLRASSLTARKDGMGEAIQTIKAANTGIEGIKALLESAKGLVESARSESGNRSTTEAQFKQVIAQIKQLVSDSGYKGTNFLSTAANTLDVLFNETGANKLTLTGFNGKASALATANGTFLNTAALTSVTGFSLASNLNTTAAAINSAISTLATQSAKLSSNLAIINARLDFTNSMVNTLKEGADKLTLADSNEEGANMLALQTRQQLGVTSLSLASQAAQGVLRLF